MSKLFAALVGPFVVLALAAMPAAAATPPHWWYHTGSQPATAEIPPGTSVPVTSGFTLTELGQRG